MSTINRTNSLTSSPLFHRLLARYLTSLALNPLRTKSLTSAILFAVQEVLANRLSGQARYAKALEERKHGKGREGQGHGSLAKLSNGDLIGLLDSWGITVKALQMAAYGGLVSAPLSHFFVGFFQRMFAGRTDTKAKVGQIVLMQLVQSPITALVYLASMAVINGARTFSQVSATVKMGYSNVLKSMWISSPLAIAFAQKFLPQETWVVWFNLVSFVIGSYMTTGIKKRQLAMQKQQLDREQRD